MPRRDNWDDRAEDFERHPFQEFVKWGVLAIIAVLIFTAVIGLATTGSVFYEGKAAKATNPSRVEKKVYDPNNTTAQIAFFHDTCNRVKTNFEQWQAAGQKVSLDQKRAASNDPIKAQQAQNELDQDTQSLIGTQQAIYSTANDYNSRSAQSTANVFKDGNLPDRIEPPVDIKDLGSWTPPNCG